MNQTALAKSAPKKEGTRYTRAVIISKQIRTHNIFLLNLLPNILERRVKGFHDHCNLPSGSGKFG